MLSALKRLAGKSSAGDGSNGNATGAPPGHQAMSSSLQRRFARGVQYNMKIIIKGDRNVGKTCLWHRLQGHKFVEEYIPTEEIQVASIQWSHKATDDIVKVEVWDVVDRGRKKRRLAGLKLENGASEEGGPVETEAALDAEWVDVYKGTNGVIMILDLTKSWTLDYIRRELPRVPNQIPVLVLANHCDMSHHRTVRLDQLTQLAEEEMTERGRNVRCADSSMRNGFGLKLLHKWFSLPFLQLQRETLLGQLERCERDTGATVAELDAWCASDEADYSRFCDQLARKRREQADSQRPPIPPPVLTPGATEVPSRAFSAPIGGGRPIPVSLPTPPASTSARITSVDEFCPDEGVALDGSFLEDVRADTGTSDPIQADDEAESDDPLSFGNGANPLVSGYVDEPPDCDSTLNSEISEITSEVVTTAAPADVWQRRSPDGGEDPDTSQLCRTLDRSASINDDIFSAPTSSHKSSHKKHSHRDKDSEKKKKKKKKKDSEGGSSSRQRRSSRDELEDFLNGSSSMASPPLSDSYEAI